MGCKKGKSKEKPNEGLYRCKKCGAIAKKKEKLCKGQKIQGA